MQSYITIVEREYNPSKSEWCPEYEVLRDFLIEKYPSWENPEKYRKIDDDEDIHDFRMLKCLCVCGIPVEKYHTKYEKREYVLLLQSSYLFSIFPRKEIVSTDQNNRKKSLIKSDFEWARPESVKLADHPPLERIADTGEDEEEMSGDFRESQEIVN